MTRHQKLLSMAARMDEAAERNATMAGRSLRKELGSPDVEDRSVADTLAASVVEWMDLSAECSRQAALLRAFAAFVNEVEP